MVVKPLIASVAALAFVAIGFYFGRRVETPPADVEEEVQRAGAEPVAEQGRQSAIRNPQSAIESATDVVWAALDAAGRGDVAAYARFLSGALRERFTDTAEIERNGEGLKQTLFGVKGIAVMAPRAIDGETCMVEAEFQYIDRKEGQRFRLRRGEGGSWRIEWIEPARPLPQTIPYGTPVDAVRE